jgi:hypothetical protein
MSSRNTPNVWQEFRVSDCYVWAQINYLDSATDYREHIPQHPIQVPHAPTLPGDLILLDPSVQVSCSQFYLWVAGLMVFLIICCFLLYELL